MNPRRWAHRFVLARHQRLDLCVCACVCVCILNDTSRYVHMHLWICMLSQIVAHPCRSARACRRLALVCVCVHVCVCASVHAHERQPLRTSIVRARSTSPDASAIASNSAAGTHRSAKTHALPAASRTTVDGVSLQISSICPATSSAPPVTFAQSPALHSSPLLARGAGIRFKSVTRIRSSNPRPPTPARWAPPPPPPPPPPPTPGARRERADCNAAISTLMMRRCACVSAGCDAAHISMSSSTRWRECSSDDRRARGVCLRRSAAATRSSNASSSVLSA